MVSCHFEICHINHHSNHDETEKNEKFRAFPCSITSKKDHQSKCNPEQPLLGMKKISKSKTIYFLAAGNRHNEIDIGDFKENESKDTEVKEFLHLLKVNKSRKQSAFLCKLVM